MSIAQKFHNVKENLWNKWKGSNRYDDFLVELNEDEISLAKEIGQKRYENNRKQNVVSPKLSDKDSSGHERDIQGALGEAAAIKWLRLNNFNPTTYQFMKTENVTSDQDEGDCDIVFDGDKLSVEIKTTQKPMNSKLIYPLYKGKKKNQPDIFVLVCQVDEKRYVVKGFTDKQTILSSIDETLPRPAYAVHEKKLDKNLTTTLLKRETK